MEVFQQDTPDEVTLPDADTRRLRARLIWEEALETIKGFGCTVLYKDQNHDASDNLYIDIDPNGKPDLVEIADGCADLLVVTHGAAIACGIDIYPVFNEVHRSNMSKLWKREDGEYEVHKREDGKVLKSPDYSPADISGCLRDQGFEDIFGE